MFQVARDLRLEQEPGSLVFPLGVLRLDDLERHLALELAVPRQPDLADSTASVLPDELKPFSRARPRGLGFEILKSDRPLS